MTGSRLQLCVVFFGFVWVCVGVEVTVLVCDWLWSRAVNGHYSCCLPMMLQRLLSYLIIEFIQISNDCSRKNFLVDCIFWDFERFHLLIQLYIKTGGRGQFTRAPGMLMPKSVLYSFLAVLLEIKVGGGKRQEITGEHRQQRSGRGAESVIGTITMTKNQL